MKLLTLILMLNISISTTCMAQVAEDAFPDFTTLNKDSINKIEEKDEIDIYKELQLIDSAATHLCEKDTAKTIELLSRFMGEFPNSGMDRFVGVKLGQLYTETGNFIEAEKAFNTVLSTNYLRRNSSIFYPPEIENCDLMIDGRKFKETKANACFGLYDLEMRKKNYKKAYESLILANTVHLPYKECGNGIEMSIVNYNKYFVDYFLKTGDTTKAINQSFDIIFEDYRYKVSKENVHILKGLLLKKYTQKAINNEIEKAISGLYKKRTIENGEEKEKIYFCLFGYCIDAINKTFNGENEGAIRAKLSVFSTLKALKDEKY
jgi:tetratricopeptide (TPR) repeat protein